MLNGRVLQGAGGRDHANRHQQRANDFSGRQRCRRAERQRLAGRFHVVPKKVEGEIGASAVVPTLANNPVNGGDGNGIGIGIGNGNGSGPI